MSILFQANFGWVAEREKAFAELFRNEKNAVVVELEPRRPTGEFAALLRRVRVALSEEMSRVSARPTGECAGASRGGVGPRRRGAETPSVGLLGAPDGRGERAVRRALTGAEFRGGDRCALGQVVVRAHLLTCCSLQELTNW